MNDDLARLRSLPHRLGFAGYPVVILPKLARDWLCDQAEENEQLRVVLLGLIEACELWASDDLDGPHVPRRVAAALIPAKAFASGVGVMGTRTSNANSREKGT